MAITENILKNFFSTVTVNFKKFPEVDEDLYYHTRSKIDGSTYTCMRHDNEVRIYNGDIHEHLYWEVEPIIKFEV